VSVFPAIVRGGAGARSWLAIGFLLLFPLCLLPAQDASAPFLLPRTIYVGDTGRLVVPLDGSFAGVQPFVLENPENLPGEPDLLIQRIELDRRGGFSRLLIDFVPFAVGTLPLPALRFAADSEEAGEYFVELSGLQVQVASILDPAWMALSQPAPPLAVPGTGLLIYGSIAVALGAFLLAIAANIWGRRHFRGLWQRRRRRLLLRGILRLLRRLRREGILGKKASPQHCLARLASGFREFLSAFTGINCRALTAAEFLELPLPRRSAAGSPQPAETALEPEFLCRLFRAWDALRFSGRDVEKPDLLEALKQAELFVLALQKFERERRQPDPALMPVGQAAGGEGL